MVTGFRVSCQRRAFLPQRACEMQFTGTIQSRSRLHLKAEKSRQFLRPGCAQGSVWRSSPWLLSHMVVFLVASLAHSCLTVNLLQLSNAHACFLPTLICKCAFYVIALTSRSCYLHEHAKGTNIYDHSSPAAARATTECGPLLDPVHQYAARQLLQNGVYTWARSSVLLARHATLPTGPSCTEFV